ncbi:SMI1/KNR4 family protein [Bacillus cereus]|uniref:SMI1/KNR4 family protein n=1 Tax=Bacillus cereus TaxID=1396 RepID=UPI000BBFB37E|nr:SMI1/KNR4 family protein [Bacillus cereus]ASZ67042.1 SMI1/KNR4 family protein [Bacillus cereus]
MSSKLDILREYNEDIQLINANEFKNINSPLIPDLWVEVFSEQDREKRIKKILSRWKKYVDNNLSNTIAYLSEYLEDIELMVSEDTYSILYTIKNQGGEDLYYEGGNPKDSFNNEELESSWREIPESIRDFYENVHNGFYDYTSESMGLMPLETITYFGDDDLEWGIIDELEEPIRINLKTSFGFFSNGMGSYIAIDYENCKNNNATFWSAKSQPKYNVDFWNFVDEWIVIGFE